MQPMMLAAILRIGGRAMTNKAYMVFVTSLSVTIALASHQAFGGGQQQHLVEALLPPIRCSSINRAIAASQWTKHRSFLLLLSFLLAGGWFWSPSGQSNSQPNVDVRQIITGGPSYTCTLDIPGDWAHRCPPSLFASPPEPPPPPPVPYELGCPAQAVTVPGGDGKDQTIKIVRC